MEVTIIENTIMHEQGFSKKAMNEQKKEKLIEIYKGYQVADWLTVIAITAAPIIVGMLEGLGLPGFSLDEMIYFISYLPTFIIIPIAIISTAYTVWNMILYVKVWPIKEIPKGGTYWFDWILTIGLTIYELFIFYVALF